MTIHTREGPDLFLLPFLYSYQNIYKNISVIPYERGMIEEREQMVYAAKKSRLYELIEEGIKEGEGKFEYPELFVRPKLKYKAEVIKQSAMFSPKMLVLCENLEIDEIVEAWSKCPQGIIKLSDLTGSNELPSRFSPRNQIEFSEYIERHVILDLLLDNFVQRYFIENKSFPFKMEHVIGKDFMTESLFIVWNHWKTIIKKKIGKETAGAPGKIFNTDFKEQAP